MPPKKQSDVEKYGSALEEMVEAEIYHDALEYGPGWTSAATGFTWAAFETACLIIGRCGPAEVAKNFPKYAREYFPGYSIASLAAALACAFIAEGQALFNSKATNGSYSSYFTPNRLLHIFKTVLTHFPLIALSNFLRDVALYASGAAVINDDNNFGSSSSDYMGSNSTAVDILNDVDQVEQPNNVQQVLVTGAIALGGLLALAIMVSRLSKQPLIDVTRKLLPEGIGGISFQLTGAWRDNWAQAVGGEYLEPIVQVSVAFAGSAIPAGVTSYLTGGAWYPLYARAKSQAEACFKSATQLEIRPFAHQKELDDAGSNSSSNEMTIN